MVGFVKPGTGHRKAPFSELEGDIHPVIDGDPAQARQGELGENMKIRGLLFLFPVDKDERDARDERDAAHDRRKRDGFRL